MELIQATENDFERVRAFYIHVIENTPDMPVCCKWVYGEHPNDKVLQDYIAAGEQYFAERGGQIIAAIALAKTQGENYRDLPWQKNLADDEVLVGHIMCVDPDLKGHGIAKELLKSVCELCRAQGKKAYRFDTLTSNNPAQKLYDSQGYPRIAERTWYTDSLGRTGFIIYEKLL